MDGYLTTYEATPGESATDKWGNEGGRCIEHAGPRARPGRHHVRAVSRAADVRAGHRGYRLADGQLRGRPDTDERFVPEEKALSDLTAARGIASEAFCLNSGCHANDDGSAMTRDD